MNSFYRAGLILFIALAILQFLTVLLTPREAEAGSSSATLRVTARVLPYTCIIDNIVFYANSKLECEKAKQNNTLPDSVRITVENGVKTIWY